MPNNFSLAEIRNDLDSKHESLSLDLGDGVQITLVNPARLEATARKAVQRDLRTIQAQAQSEDQDPVELDNAVNSVLSAIVADGKGSLLTEIIAGDTGLAFHLFNMWLEVTQAGEASSSPNS
jgi:hypothetical protein